ncbi:MAG: hypothetical protein ACREMF_01560 [Gemmatimonadales bacterium]
MRAGLLLVIPAIAWGQTPTHLPGPVTPVAYRGFVLAAPYADFTIRARALVAPNAAPLVCNTSRRTAQLMECGQWIRDPSDSAGFYLAAYVLEGRVAFLSFGDSGGAPLVARVQRDLTTRFGQPRATRGSMWEWRSGREVVRLTWRGRGAARWFYIALWDEELMDRIARYVPRRPR